MEKIYQCGEITLGDVVKSLNGSGDPFMVPDLQRGFVWDATKIMALVDTLIKGWPFGQFFLVELKKQSAMPFSPRSLYSQVPLERISEESKYFKTLSIPSYSPTYRLVLDGQQRLQTIALAFCKTDGIFMDAKDWMELNNPQSSYRKRSGYECSRATLHVNFKNLYNQLNNNIADLDFTNNNKNKILEWVFQGELNCPWWNIELLPRTYSEVKDESLPLEYLWENSTEDKRAGIKIGNEDWREALNSFCEHLVMMQQLMLPYISLKEDDNICSDAFNEMVLNIFTRLNRGGVQLSREDITLSWIKRNWKSNEVANGSKSGDECLKELKCELYDKFNADITSDQLVRSIASIWTIIERDAKQITNADLMDGITLRTAAQWISNNWLAIKHAYFDIFEVMKARDLKYQCQYYSLQPIILLVSWQIIGKLWGAKLSGEKKTIQSNFNQLFFDELIPKVDRFVFAGQWSGAWDNMFVFSSLSKTHEQLKECTNLDVAKKILIDYFDNSIKEMQETARNHIANLNADNRSQVSRYRLPLWVWQRLDIFRKDYSKKLATCVDGQYEGLPHVDHCVAHEWWISKWKKHCADYGVEVDSKKYIDNTVAINKIGNCNILVNSLNESKGKKTLSVFLQEVLSSKDDIEKCCNALKIPSEIFDPETATLTDILLQIEQRTKVIKDDLISFIDGKLSRT